MSGFRKIARDAARSQSYKSSHTTGMFHYFFNKIWREKAGHKQNLRMNSTRVATGRKAAKRHRKAK